MSREPNFDRARFVCDEMAIRHPHILGEKWRTTLDMDSEIETKIDELTSKLT